jgi:hypothetical protein
MGWTGRLPTSPPSERILTILDFSRVECGWVRLTPGELIRDAVESALTFYLGKTEFEEDRVRLGVAFTRFYSLLVEITRIQRSRPG